MCPDGQMSIERPLQATYPSTARPPPSPQQAPCEVVSSLVNTRVFDTKGEASLIQKSHDNSTVIVTEDTLSESYKHLNDPMPDRL
mmetsp:Transcript_45388/g.119166  ORF Transcript_45388/g.119166 Transcript_45388/m.119166 type:complete len:85 (+) Transcript_45388:335-589(+)